MSRRPAVAFTALALLPALLLAMVLAGCTRKTPPQPTGAPTTPTVTASASPSEPSASPTAPAASPSKAPASPSKAPSPRPPTSPAPFPAYLAGQDITKIPTSSKIVALTFDAGANADGLSSILATLDAKNVTGTFFLTGDFVQVYPQRARSIATAGHRLGNHTVDHPHLSAMTDAQVRDQILRADLLIRQATGESPRPWFRFPYGDRTTHTIAVVNGTGYACVRWTVDTLGWKGTNPGGQTTATVTRRVLDAATPGEIVLMHVGSNPDDHTTLDAAALPGVIDGLRAKGYSFVTLDALL